VKTLTRLQGGLCAVASIAVLAGLLAGGLLSCGAEGDRASEPPSAATADAAQPAGDAAEAADTPRADVGTPAAAGVVLVTFDTTRADRIGAYGYAAAHTPTLDRLAAEGVLFERALAPAPLTLPSHASILTGRFPAAHGVHDNALYRLGADEVALAEVFHAAGWRTGAFIGSVVLDSRYGLDQGFEVYHGLTGSVTSSSTLHERNAASVVDDAIAWISGLDRDERFFAWVHFYDPHYQYTVHEPWSSLEPYDSEIAYTDDQLGRLLRFVEHRDDLLVAVTADHGESLGDHGELTHTIFIYQSTVSVPLIWWGRRIHEPPGTRVAATVSNVAVAPSLLALSGISPEALPDSEAPLFTTEGKLADIAPHAVLLESYFPYNSHRWHALRGLVVDHQKLIEGVEPELYDLDSDAAELHDLAASDPAAVRELQTRLETEFAARSSAPSESAHEPGTAERAQLEALGYAVGSTRGDPLRAGLPDPRDRIGDKKLALDGLQLVTEGSQLKLQATQRTGAQAAEFERQARLKLERGRAMLAQIVAANPNDVFASARLAIAEGELGNFASAIDRLERAVREEPDQPWIHGNLARVYANAGRDDDAAREMQKAIEMGPLEPMNYEWLIRYYTDKGDSAAVRHWLEALAAALVPGSHEQRAVLHRIEALDSR